MSRLISDIGVTKARSDRMANTGFRVYTQDAFGAKTAQ
jgi:hypothetical protein